MPRMASQKENIVAKVMSTAKLALSEKEGENTEAARTAAMTAITLMKEHDLVVIPRSDLEKVVEGRKEIAAAEEKANRNLLMGLAIGFFGGKGGLKL